ncbi:hypothetical protein CA54_39920 [Symmachiella macrocystis]|uniref:Uncharacterized protein n=1 Tax=Symmachiella macrocystis TaxID=2527985 RepID=A0A5C6B902_9PLAN|nr:DUF6768 family protein [Symmachiella macrocystis]TWU08755.1 hypothetical protein CA54_39920 [Symmachiella macrocystis]
MTGHDIDDKIKQALAAEDADLYAQFAQEPSLLEQGLELLQSRNRWVTALVMISTMIFLVLGFYSLWRFFGAQEMKALMSWALGFGFCMAAVSMMKIWAWMEIQKNNTVREIKRLELQVARLTQRLGEPQ